MKIKFGKYTIKKEDKFNFGLYKTVKKGTAFGKGGVGTTEKFIGYYGKLSGAVNKLLNNEILESDDVLDLKSLLETISRIETLVESKYDKEAKWHIHWRGEIKWKLMN